MSGFGADPTQQAPDPAQVFGDPSQVPAFAQPQQAQQQEPGEPAEPQGDPQAETLDAEMNILEAIEAGCEMCIAATEVNAEDYMRFAQGVSFLAGALEALQPKPDTAAAQVASTGMRVDQQHMATLLKAEKDIHEARARHNEQQVQSAQQSVPPPPQANRPGQQPPSARG